MNFSLSSKIKNSLFQIKYRNLKHSIYKKYTQKLAHTQTNASFKLLLMVCIHSLYYMDYFTVLFHFKLKPKKHDYNCISYVIDIRFTNYDLNK